MCALFVPPSVTGMHDATQQTQPTVQSFDEKFECIKYRFDTSSTFPDVHAYRTFENPTNPFTYFSPRPCGLHFRLCRGWPSLTRLTFEANIYNQNPNHSTNSFPPESNTTQTNESQIYNRLTISSTINRRQLHNRRDPKND